MCNRRHVRPRRPRKGRFLVHGEAEWFTVVQLDQCDVHKKLSKKCADNYLCIIQTGREPCVLV